MEPSIRHFIQQFRPHQLIYQTTLLIMAVIINKIQFTMNHVIFGFLFILLLTPAFTLMNDYAHRKQDLIMGRNRLFGQNLNSQLILLIFIIIMIILNIISFKSGIITVVYFWFLFISTITYGFAKKWRYTFLSYFSRFLSGFLTMILYGSLVNPLKTELFMLPGVIVGILDLIGNVAGDIRDYKKDIYANVSSFPVRFGRRKTMEFIFILVTITYIFLIFLKLNPIYLFLSFFWVFISLLLYLKSSEVWAHASFHGPKLQQFIWIGFAFSNLSINSQIFTIGMVFSLIIGIFWIISYIIYLWSNYMIKFDLNYPLFSYLNHLKS